MHQVDASFISLSQVIDLLTSYFQAAFLHVLVTQETIRQEMLSLGLHVV